MRFKYTEIKNAYLEIKKFLEYKSSMTVKDLNTTIVDDLGLWGDDNLFLLEAFLNKYDVDFSKFNYDAHFDSEGEFVDFKTVVFGILKLPIRIANSLIIKFISYNTYNKIDSMLYEKTNEKKDLTFGDLILSKLNGEFCLRNEYRIELAK